MFVTCKVCNKNKWYWAVLLGMLLLPLAQLTAVVPPVPVEITYQGHIEESSLPVNGVRALLFRITDVDGRATGIWDSGVQSVVVSSGTFNYVLGSNVSLNMVDWENPPSEGFYLEVKMGTATARLEDELVLMGPRSSINTHLYEKFYKGKSGGEGYRVYYTAPSVTSSKGVISNETINAAITYKYARANNYWDVLDTTQEWRAKAKDILMQYVEETGLKEYFVDAGIVGSLAFGIARRAGDNEEDPSDIDFVVFLNLNDENISELKDRDNTLENIRIRYVQIMIKELSLQCPVDIYLHSIKRRRVGNQKYIYYSLLQDEMYGRDDGEKVYVTMVCYKNIYLQFKRAEYIRFREDCKKNETRYKGILSSDQRLLYYDENTEKVLLKSN